jgi:transposase
MSKQRKQYTVEFKREAVQLWESSGKAAAEIEKDLGITPGLLYRWKSRLAKQAAAEADGSAAESAELRRLKRELALVKQERDILKKAVGIFSRPNE